MSRKPSPRPPRPPEAPPPQWFARLDPPPEISAAPLAVAFSGGPDSLSLLHALHRHRAGKELRALHVHHGLQDLADGWADDCLRFSHAIGISCEILKVRIDPRDPAGPEAAARAARYAVLGAALRPGEVLVTAHHRDDQAETVLLRLLRGSGVDGLAGMRPLQTFASGWLWRPLLEVPRAALAGYAQAHDLHGVDDPHNRDPRYARSWVRKTLLPSVRERHPQVIEALARTARLAGEAAELAADLAALDLARAARGPTLDLDALSELSPARRANLLRHWLRDLRLPLPDAATMARIWDEVVDARADAEPCLRWPGAELRRYRSRLHALPPLPPVPSADARLRWDSGPRIELPPGCGCLLANQAPAQALEVRFAGGGERLRLPRARQSRALRNLFQETAVPPWVRSRTPLIEIEGRLAFVGGVGESEEWQRFCAERDWQPRWLSPFSAA